MQRTRHHATVICRRAIDGADIEGSNQSAGACIKPHGKNGNALDGWQSNAWLGNHGSRMILGILR
ncbi:MAG: hypothetical protein WAL15_18175 [Xanthobacteraceae bacterium]